MFESFRKFLPEVSEGRRHPAHFEHNDYRLAAAALLVHTAAIDGNMSDLERDKLHAVVKRQFGLDEATTGELVAEATEAEREAIDLYHFTSLINRSLDEEICTSRRGSWRRRGRSLWGQQWVVDNRPGANGIIGMDAVAKAKADTLVYASASVRRQSCCCLFTDVGSWVWLWT